MKKGSVKVLIITAIIIILILSLIGIGYAFYLKKKDREKELNTPDSVVSSFIENINNQNYESAYNLLSEESKNKVSMQDFEAKYKEINDELYITKTDISNIRIDKVDVNNSNVMYTTKLSSAFGEIDYENVIHLQKKEDKKYYIDWEYSSIYPDLQKTDKIDIDKEYAKRGSLIDRKGILLAGSGYIASVGLVPGWMNEETKAQDIAKVAELLGMTVENVNKKMSASYVKSDTFVELATISKQNQTTLYGLNAIDGVKIKDISSRVYPLGEKAAHLTGYVQKANAKDLENNKTYDENSLIGRAGLESAYEDRLKGKDGYEINLLNENLSFISIISDTSRSIYDSI